MPKEKEQVNGAPKRNLPKKRNPEMTNPDHAELIKNRRLGQTTLGVKPGQVGTSNATKPENLGPFDYAHLRAPLPKDLDGSEIHAHHPSTPMPPRFYFLMRRSSDGFVSATGMFKAAFPWAKIAEENAERDYIKELPSTAHDEVAGNVWVSEHYAIELAAEYGITPWIVALLDESPIQQTNDEPKAISPPPRFKFTANDKPFLPPPNGTPARASTPKSRGRPRGTSPVKNASPAKSTKKPRATKKEKEADAVTAREASATLQATLEDAATVTEAPSEAVDGEKVMVEVESNVEKKGNTETTTTNVKIEMPTGSPELPLPENPERMIEEAKQMVSEAKKMNGESSTSARKRKAEEMDDDSDEAGDNELQPSKKARRLEEELKTQKVRSRAMACVAGVMALG
ncbi:hypothetical protein ACLMJK_003527 [Lecanora helva]